MIQNKFTTTLSRLQAFQPCADGWHTLLTALGKTAADDEPLAVGVILNSNYHADALWALRAVDGIEREARLLACDYAEQALPVWCAYSPDDHRPAEAIRVARLYADGRATAGELESARFAALDAAWGRALDTTRSAARSAAFFAASAAASSAAHIAVWSGWPAANAARDAATGSPWDAARDASIAAAWAAGDGGRASTYAWQEARLRQMLRGKIYQQEATQ